MKVETSELIGPGLAWAVGVALGMELSLYGVDPSIRARVPGLGVHAPWRPDTYYNQSAYILCENKISRVWDDILQVWRASDKDQKYIGYGESDLVAGLRCFVASTLGSEVEIPEVLV